MDATGYAVSCKNRGALEPFNEGMLAFVTLNGDSMSFFQKALDLDPDFLIVHCVLVRSNVITRLRFNTVD